MQWLTNILCGADFEESAESVLEFVAEKCHAQAAFLYLFSRRKGAFELHRGWARGGTSVPTAAIFDRKIDVDATSGAVGYVLLNGCVQRESADDTELVRACVQELSRRRVVDNFFKAIRTPVDFSDADNYFRKTAELLSDALAMDLVAIRYLAQRGESSDLDQTRLITDAFYSYRDPQLTDDVSFDGELPAPFVEAIGAAKEALKSNGAQTAQYEIVNPSDPRFSFLSRAKILRNIRCFAIFPILSKDYEGKPYVYGLISCASESISSFSDLHRNAVETSMQLIGVAISNHLSYREVRRLTSNVYEQIFSATALDLAQSAKHQLDNIGHELSIARRRLDMIKPFIRE